ncbi:ribose-5-phosphate isomerase RpiA [Pontivivens insulae]|uniref:Ribose-5-phosphate isomerase A n=1 Tax=Pontivivens insulae TaxID=1639689 RepID=A0A2R8AFV0_9RHOB|nr:ribose-5-phosphate isomerase RpiA [Pontivivens insulae]RED12311.1 ribose-5-phosphate isomerase [Pontivivens insulae]SPF31067.1 Ribose-5-phosphate isomerase A [Pontivivens insulae]
MPDRLTPQNRAKYAAARGALNYVEKDMKLGLGTGSTAEWFVRLLAPHAEQQNLNLTCTSTSERTADLAAHLGLRVVTLDEAGWLDLTIDGADEVDPDLNLIKGGGAAHLREKIVATASDRMVVITDDSKLVGKLGKFPLPVEVIPFGWSATRSLIEEVLEESDVAGTRVEIRMNGEMPVQTDEGNLVLDLHLEAINAPEELSLMLNRIPGVVENGLFLGMADEVSLGLTDGTAQAVVAGGTGRELAYVDELDIASILAAGT